MKLPCGGLVPEKIPENAGIFYCSKGHEHTPEDLRRRLIAATAEAKRAPARKLRAAVWTLGLAGAAASSGLEQGLRGCQLFGRELGLWRLLGREWTGVDLLMIAVPLMVGWAALAGRPSKKPKP